MLLVLMQMAGGGFYFLNKVGMWLAERAKLRGDTLNQRRWRITAWTVYLLGLPPWLVIFVHEQRWIAAALELSGGPAMLLGLINAYRSKEGSSPRWLFDLSVAFSGAGLVYSYYDLGQLTSLNQLLEVGVVTGYLVGNNLLANERSSGYWWYMLMHVCCAWLMWRLDYTFLVALQLLSLGLIMRAHRIATQSAP